jgi:hypothetical protein
MSKKFKVNEEGAVTMSVGGGAIPSLTNPTDAYALQLDKYKKTMRSRILRRKKP